MSLIERLEELMILLPGCRKHEQEIMQKQINLILPKLLTLVQKADNMALQYEGMLEWISDPDCECCHCDDHDKLVEVLEDYRRVKAALEASDEPS